jgi:hypothetical protein
MGKIFLLAQKIPKNPKKLPKMVQKFEVGGG